MHCARLQRWYDCCSINAWLVMFSVWLTTLPVSHIPHPPIPVLDAQIWGQNFYQCFCDVLLWPARACSVELKYDKILAVGGRGCELGLLKVQKNRISSIFRLTHMLTTRSNFLRWTIRISGRVHWPVFLFLIWALRSATENSDKIFGGALKSAIFLK